MIAKNIWTRDPLLDVQDGKLVLRHGDKIQVLEPVWDGDRVTLGCTTVTWEAARLVMADAWKKFQ